MVHGWYYGVQYEIYLNKQIDFYDDILPICIDAREMVSLEKIKKGCNDTKIVIIPYENFNKRFDERKYTSAYITSQNELSYDYKLNRKDNPELFKYWDVKFYGKNIKHSEEFETYTEEMFENLEKKVEELSNKYNERDYYEKYSSEERDNFDIEKSIFRDVLNVQRIIRNKEYFEEIKDIERELTNIELTDKEKELINKFVNNPKLEGAIAFHGINLIDGFY